MDIRCFHKNRLGCHRPRVGAIENSTEFNENVSLLCRSGLLRGFLLALVPADDLEPSPGLHGPDRASPARPRPASSDQAENEKEEKMVQYLLIID